MKLLKMKILKRYSAFMIVWAVSSVANAGVAKVVPHLDPDMPGAEARKLLDQAQQKSRARFLLERDPLSAILDMGKRNLQWIDRINSVRPDDRKLQLYTPDAVVGYPIDRPSVSNRKLLMERFDQMKENELPTALKEILFQGESGALPTTHPMVDDATFIEWARKVDRIYSNASRWLLQEPSLSYYARVAIRDVRGYLVLAGVQDLASKLSNWSALPQDEKTKLKRGLLGICKNTRNSEALCQKEFDQAVSTATGLKGSGVKGFYDRYIQRARTNYQSFFVLGAQRPEARWTAKEPEILFFPFLRPANVAVENYLRDNIEDEWKWNRDAIRWNLRMEFLDRNDGDLAHVEFEEGATPHVNGLGGSVITMDANRSINDYMSKWTIRHEFGHVLGFPDCYVEFYDEAQGVMINYQIDLDNLMCSRRGKLQKTHFDEMKRVYFRD